MSFSHCLPAGKIKRWVFLTGPKSLLSSPLTVPMATSSSGAADGGCRPTSSTWPHKVGACVELRAGLCCCDSSCRQTENGPLLPAALHRALLAYKDIYKCDSVLRWHSRSSRRTCHKSLHQLTCLVSYRSYHGHSSFSSWPWNRAVWKRMGKQLGGSNDVTPQCLNLFETLVQKISGFAACDTTVSKDTFHKTQRSERTSQAAQRDAALTTVSEGRDFDINSDINSPAEVASHCNYHKNSKYWNAALTPPPIVITPASASQGGLLSRQ